MPDDTRELRDVYYRCPECGGQGVVRDADRGLWDAECPLCEGTGDYDEGAAP